MNFQDFFLAANIIGSETLNLMPWISQNSESSPLQVSEGVCDRFILADIVIIYTCFGSSQTIVSLKVTTISSLARETSAVIQKMT